jgi:hypothetical protein
MVCWIDEPDGDPFCGGEEIVSNTSAWQKMQFIYGRENSHE